VSESVIAEKPGSHRAFVDHAFDHALAFAHGTRSLALHVAEVGSPPSPPRPLTNRPPADQPLAPVPASVSNTRMPRLAALLAIALIAACTKVDSDVSRAKMNADFKDMFVGRDRGYFGYREMIEQATVRSPRSSRYQYNEPAWVSNYIVTRAVRGLGGTAWPNADYLAGSVDRLMYVMHYDPTPIVRATACAQLGRIAQRIGIPATDPYPFVELADEKIQQVSQDLFKIQQRVEKGERIKESLVIERLDTFEKLYPTRMLLAIQMMRALSSSPVVQAAPGPLRDTTERVIPVIARRTISIALAQLSCGNVYRPRVIADESAEVRGRAIEVLTALNDPVARDFAVARLWDEDYPAERDEMVRMRLLEYLGNVGGPGARSIPSGG